MVGKRSASEHSGRIVREEFLPPSSPIVIVVAPRIDPTRNDLRVMPNPLGSRRQMHKIPNLPAKLREDVRLDATVIETYGGMPIKDDPLDVATSLTHARATIRI